MCIYTSLWLLCAHVCIYPYVHVYVLCTHTCGDQWSTLSVNSQALSTLVVFFFSNYMHLFTKGVSHSTRWKSENSFRELTLSFQHVNYWDQTQVSRLRCQTSLPAKPSWQLPCVRDMLSYWPGQQAPGSVTASQEQSYSLHHNLSLGF